MIKLKTGGWSNKKVSEQLNTFLFQTPESLQKIRIERVWTLGMNNLNNQYEVKTIGMHNVNDKIFNDIRQESMGSTEQPRHPCHKWLDHHINDLWCHSVCSQRILETMVLLFCDYLRAIVPKRNRKFVLENIHRLFPQNEPTWLKIYILFWGVSFSKSIGNSETQSSMVAQLRLIVTSWL